ncbi:uncharacterized protein Z520_12218 [Fonsecaea multimorphosa CBS 102226]|uniref:Uncharacterized protein n=1 Tax=Fonsecaea multimorphosa CBS 102226 TaxID=1442371 RepID=A0A0D2JNJ9_9EURO|nr:uncharacterized protein Z520_12218 [Fonsecaea multimorphosa CBS 102226]KIX92064.1 hypothetical protein Z520_12218 [Fonsecaea multimorphosa CBS 102226]
MQMRRTRPMLQSQDFGPIRPQTPPWLRNNTELRALQQKMTGLIQVIQNRAIEQGGLPEELKQLLDKGHDALVDVVQRVVGIAE